MSIEVSKLIRKNVSVWYKVKVLFSVFLLHSYYIVAEAIFPCNLIRIGKVIDLLISIETFIEIALATA